MAHAPATTVRIDPQLKAEASDVLDELGLSLSAGVTAFLKAVVRERGLPFDMRLTADTPTLPGTSLDDGGSKTGEASTSATAAAGNASLNRAGMAKKDEFYTQMADVEAELTHYRNQFAGASVLCNCDDPFESSFFRFFALHFAEYGMKRLVATSYSASSFGGTGRPVMELVPSRMGERRPAYKAVVTSTGGLTPDSALGARELTDLFALPGNSIAALDGDGDFRSRECLALLDDADVVATNPPFSLFREYIGTLVSRDKKFAIIGTINAVTYKEVFPLIKDDKMWLGTSIHSGDRKFLVPDDYPLDAAGCGVDEDGRFIRVKGVRWFTNLEAPQRHTELFLTETYDPARYRRFDNYDAINIPRTKDIPRDYPGIMGVPITFLDKYDPDQFEILLLANGNVRANADRATLQAVGYRRDPNDRGGVGVIDGKRLYARLLIRNKHPERSKVTA